MPPEINTIVFRKVGINVKILFQQLLIPFYFLSFAVTDNRA